VFPRKCQNESTAGRMVTERNLGLLSHQDTDSEGLEEDLVEDTLKEAIWQPWVFLE